MGMKGCDQKLKQQAMQAVMSGKPFKVPSSGTAQATAGANFNGAAPAPAIGGGAVKGGVPRKAAVLYDDEQETQMDELFSYEERLCWQVCLDGIWTEMDGATNALLEEAQKSGKECVVSTGQSNKSLFPQINRSFRGRQLRNMSYSFDLKRMKQTNIG